MAPEIWSLFFRGAELTQCWLHEQVSHVWKGCSIRKRKEIRRRLIEESSHNREYQTAVKWATENIELFQYHPIPTELTKHC